MTDYYTPEELDAMPTDTRLSDYEGDSWWKLANGNWTWAGLLKSGLDADSSDLIENFKTGQLPSNPESQPPTLGELVALRDSILKERGITPSGPAMDMCHAKLEDVDQIIAERMGWVS